MNACIHERAWLLTIAAFIAVVGALFGEAAPLHWDIGMGLLAGLCIAIALFGNKGEKA